MVRVNMVVEGQTEIAFVKELLVLPFSDLSIYLYPCLIGKPGHKGGISYNRAKSDVLRFLRQERSTYCTTMFDYYGLPDNFPGLPIRGNYQSAEKAEIIEQALKQDIIQALDYSIDPDRFIPYIQIHEFEALLFSDPHALAKSIYRSELSSQFEKARTQFHSPEDIDDNPNTAPSKRIKNICSEYMKPIHGILAAIEIGLPKIRSECQHFDQWLKKLETLRL